MRYRWLSLLVLLMVLAAVLLLYGCTKPPAGEAGPKTPPGATAPAGQPQQPTNPTEDKALQAAQELGTKTTNSVTTTPSGLRYIDVKLGKGAAAKEKETAVVHYTGWLVSGEKFDSSKDRNEPFRFGIGAGQVIKGWDEGVAGMKPGGIRKLIVPPELGYGDRGIGPIPPGATLIFEVELLKTER